MAQDVETGLVLRMEATLSKFERQMQRAREVGAKTATETERRFEYMNDRMGRSAKSSADAITRGLDDQKRRYDSIRSSLDPVYAATVRLEAEERDLAKAFQFGAISAEEHAKALEMVRGRYQAVATSAQGAATATVAQGQATGRLLNLSGSGRFVLQNTANQLGDIAVQLQTGAGMARVMGFQLPQLIGGFGAMSGAVGVLAPLLATVVAIGIPVVAMLATMGKSGENLEDRFKSLEKAVDDYSSAAKSAFLPTAQLAEKYGTATAAAREFIGALQDITKVNALEEMQATLQRISTTFGGFSLEAPGDGMSSLPSEWEETLRALQNQLDLVGVDAMRVAQELRQLGEAATPEDAVRAAQELMEALEGALGPYEDMNTEARELYENVREAGDNAAQLQGAATGAASAISGAASEAGRLADELARAVDNAINLAAQGISDVRRAKIEYDFRDDPVGRAAALAREQFDTQTNLPANADSTIRNVVEQERREFVAAATEAERYRQAIAAWRKEQADAAKGGKPKRESGGRSKREQPGFFDVTDREIAQVERQMEMIGKTSAQVAEMTARYRLLDEAKERNLDLDARQLASGMTLRQEIDANAQAIGKMTQEYERASQQADFYAEIQQNVKSGIVDAIIEGEGLVGVLANVAEAFARAAFEAALFGEGPLGGQGGGLLGGLLSSVFPKFASGTNFAPGGAAIVGERGPELVNLPRGSQVIPNHRISPADGTVRIMIEEAPGFAARVRTEAQGVAIETTRQGLRHYDRHLGPRVQRAAENPRRIG
jgi:methyl-accepting chemotaxis protein